MTDPVVYLWWSVDVLYLLRAWMVRDTVHHGPIYTYTVQFLSLGHQMHSLLSNICSNPTSSSYAGFVCVFFLFFVVVVVVVLGGGEGAIL